MSSLNLDDPGAFRMLRSMAKPDPAEPLELTYPLRTAARLTGLSPEVLRAWERRYGAVDPLRTSGGTRRYRASDLERLRLLKAAVDAGHRIGQVAKLDTAALRERSEPDPVATNTTVDAILTSLERLDADEARRLLGLQLSALGPSAFAREVAVPLLREIGERWRRDETGIASEHLASSIIRSQLAIAMNPTALSRLGPRIVFATPEGERHDLGLQMAAVIALAAGASPVYLGPELPLADCVASVASSEAGVLALSIVTLPTEAARALLTELRKRLPDGVRLWVGGHGAAEIGPMAGVEHLPDFERLEQEVLTLTLAQSGDR